MKPSILNIFLLIGKIIVPSFLSVFLLLCLNEYIEYQFVLIFGIIIIFFNHRKTKYNFLLSFLIAIILSYVIFFLSIALYFALGYIITGGETEKEIESFASGVPFVKLAALIPIAVISPLLTYYGYRFLFKIKKTNYYLIVKWISIFILIALGLTKFIFDDDNLFMFWQFVMILALQLILYQKELVALFRSK